MFLVGVGVPILRTRAPPKWLGVVALLLAVTAVTSRSSSGFAVDLARDSVAGYGPTSWTPSAQP
jgi:hypothetical protein